MVETSGLYKEIMSVPHKTLTSLKVFLSNGVSVTYAYGALRSIRTSHAAFNGNSPMIGCCTSRKIDCVMLYPQEPIPERAKMQLFVQIAKLSDPTCVSEEIPQGTFYIDSRKSNITEGTRHLRIIGYDAIIFAEADFDKTAFPFPAKDVDVVNHIAGVLGVSVDPETISFMTAAYEIQPGEDEEFTYREMLSYIAGMYGGNFVISKAGLLKLVPVWITLPETNYLIDNVGNYITFGGDRIID